jgi:hypothetical protein
VSAGAHKAELLHKQQSVILRATLFVRKAQMCRAVQHEVMCVDPSNVTLSALISELIEIESELLVVTRKFFWRGECVPDEDYLERSRLLRAKHVAKTEKLNCYLAPHPDLGAGMECCHLWVLPRAQELP